MKEILSKNLFIYFIIIFLFQISPIANSKNRKFLNQLVSNNWEKIENHLEDNKKINWEKIENDLEDNSKINWEKIKINNNRKDIFDSEITNIDNEIKVNKTVDKTSGKFQYKLIDPSKENKDSLIKNKNYKISSLNRSIVFGEKIIGPDIGWIVPPGFKWSRNYRFDSSIRGYNQTLSYKRKSNQGMFTWNQGDAVGQFFYQMFTKERYTLGLNLGMRSIKYGGAGGSTSIGEGLSLGFRADHEISDSSGIALGAEQLLHFDGVTDTGRDIYFTASKAFWKNQNMGNFPLKIATAGIGTGRLAEGNIKGFCSDFLGGAGTEVLHQRRLCWAPVFSLAYLFNEKVSTFFEYNSRYFLLGSSIAPFNEIPFRGTIAITISDHIDNYKVKNLDEITYTFRLSLGF